jgi:hypothetical protein
MTDEILRRIQSYISGDISRREFEEWFLPATWNLDEAQDAGGHALAAQIYLAIAEFDNGNLDEAEFIERLSEISMAAKSGKTSSGQRR